MHRTPSRDHESGHPWGCCESPLRASPHSRRMIPHTVSHRKVGAQRNYGRSRPSRRRTKRSNDVSPADATEVVTTLLDMPREVLAGLAARVLAALGSVALGLLKVALWVVIAAGVALFGALFLVGGFVAGRWTLQRMTGIADDTAAGQATELQDQ